MPTSEWPVQSNEEHSIGVANRAVKFAAEFDCADWGRIIGLLHDKGKEKIDFQRYIRKVSEYDISVPSYKDKTHAYVGGLLAKEMYGPLSLFLSYPIIGHHAGLYDYGDFEEIIKKRLPPEIRHDVNKVPLSIPRRLDSMEKKDFHHFIRMLYSCLVDADYLDTESFMNEENTKLRGHKKTLQQLSLDLKSYLDSFVAKAADSPINKIRNIVQKRCLEISNGAPGFYSLTVPTGGGKTISSVVWAVNHALKQGKKRIIIAIPYTSIIVQTAETLRKIFGEENVLEHHSNTNMEKVKESKTKKDEKLADMRLKMKLATENWDYPIVITTNVQLFESMFSNKPSSCRKLHNLCNSVLILDEVQTLPIDYLQPIVDALKTYQRLFGMSVLFTTASQPVLTGIHRGCNPTVELRGIEQITEIIPESFQLHEKLRRVQLHIDDTPSTYDEIAAKLQNYNRVLCIVNTRRDAQELYSRLPKDGTTIHLSRMMCASHIRQTIDQIKSRLGQEGDAPIRVISTQLIEAGVDLDFPIVFRQEAGLDSILQAAGRCNREGKLGISDTYIFSLGKERALPRGYISRANDARKNLQIQESTDCFSPILMAKYFEQLYSRSDSFDKGPDGEKQLIADLLCKPFDFCFETAAKKFKLIQDASIGIIVNWENSAELIHQLLEKGPQYAVMKQLSRYSVNLRKTDFDQLVSGGFIQEVLEGVYWLPDREQYDEKIGLVIENHWLDEILIK